MWSMPSQKFVEGKIIYISYKKWLFYRLKSEGALKEKWWDKMKKNNN